MFDSFPAGSGADGDLFPRSTVEFATEKVPAAGLDVVE